MRVDNWEKNLHAVVKEAMTKEFSYGEHDCCLFAADVVEAITGVDPAGPDWRGRYNSETAARRRMAQLGFDDEEDVVTETFEAHGFKKIDVNFAQRGDVAVVGGENGKSVGVIYDGGVAVPNRNGRGLTFFSRDDAIAAWRIK